MSRVRRIVFAKGARARRAQKENAATHADLVLRLLERRPELRQLMRKALQEEDDLRKMFCNGPGWEKSE